MERLGGVGVHTLEELQTFSSRVTPAQRRKRHLPRAAPRPGVFFRDERARVLYVGTSRDLRSRVRSYFTSSETRSRMGEMVGIAAGVDGIECATALEAEVRELRLIAEHKPRYNRRSRFPEKVHFVKLTREPWPRLRSCVGCSTTTPTTSTRSPPRRRPRRAPAAARHVPGAAVLRTAPRDPSRSACVLAEMGRRLSPCDGSVDDSTYAAVVRQLRELPCAAPTTWSRRSTGWPHSPPTSGSRRRDPPGPARGVRACGRQDPALVRPHPPPRGGGGPAGGRREVAARRGTAGSPQRVIPPGADAHSYVATLRLSAETVPAAPVPRPQATAEETEKILRWLESPGIRLRRRRRRVDLPGRRRDPPPRRPRRGQPVPPPLVPFAERRGITTVHQPAR